MSNMGFLSNEYRQANTFADNLSKIMEKVNDEDRELDRQTQLRLTTVLSAMLDLLDPMEDTGVAGEEVVQIPITLVMRLDDEPAPDGRRYRVVIKDLIERLSQPDAQPSDDDREMLNSIWRAARGEAADVFRRMVHD